MHGKLMTRALCLLALAAVGGCSDDPVSPDGPVTADRVVDRETLKAFVERAATTVEESVSSPAEAYPFADATFRPEGEWRHGSVYIYVVSLDGISLFNAVQPSIEGTNLWDLEDRNGVKVVQDLIAEANSGGGYVEYLWDNPAVTGDEEDGSPKVGYATLATVAGESILIGSGFYR